MSQQLRIAGQSVVGGQMAAQQGDEIAQSHLGRRGFTTGQGQLEAQLGQPVADTDVDESAVSGEPAERRVQRAQQGAGQRVGVDLAELSPGEGGGTDPTQLVGEILGLRIDLLQHGVHDGAEQYAARQSLHRRRLVETRRGSSIGHGRVERCRGQRRRLGLVLLPGDVDLTSHLTPDLTPDRLAEGAGRAGQAVCGGGQRGVGGPPPFQVQ